MRHYDENGDTEYACGGDDDCSDVEMTPDCVEGLKHRWTHEGEGGCRENPGVWSLGGTAIQSSRRCLLCGVREVEVEYGSQRNPGQCDSRRYEPGEVDENEVLREHARLRRNRARRGRHEHRRVGESETRPFLGPVGMRQNEAAHGGVCYVARCKCGATRRTNVNGCHVERGEWVKEMAE